MADFPDFDSHLSADDPAADFLAREQSELAGLEEFDTTNNETDQGGFEFVDPGMHELEGEPTSQQQASGVAVLINGPADMYSAICQQDTIFAEPEKILIWREEQRERLAEKDAAEERERSEWSRRARKELEDWYKHHAEQVEKAKENNRIENEEFMKQRAAEEAFVRDRDEKAPGQAWDKITRLCEFNQKNSKNTKDVSRMRSILLQMKQTPLVR